MLRLIENHWQIVNQLEIFNKFVYFIRQFWATPYIDSNEENEWAAEDTQKIQRPLHSGKIYKNCTT